MKNYIIFKTGSDDIVFKTNSRKRAIAKLKELEWGDNVEYFEHFSEYIPLPRYHLKCKNKVYDVANYNNMLKGEK